MYTVYIYTRVSSAALISEGISGIGPDHEAHWIRGCRSPHLALADRWGPRRADSIPALSLVVSGRTEPVALGDLPTQNGRPD
jgi:hypothetical protein